MTDKVLGFYPKENKERAKNGCWTGSYLVELDNLLSVRLKSESVGIEELKKEIDTMIKYSGTALPPSKLGEFRKGYLLALERAKIRLLSAAKKEAEKK